MQRDASAQVTGSVLTHGHDGIPVIFLSESAADRREVLPRLFFLQQADLVNLAEDAPEDTNPPVGVCRIGTRGLQVAVKSTGEPGSGMDFRVNWGETPMSWQLTVLGAGCLWMCLLDDGEYAQVTHGGTPPSRPVPVLKLGARFV